MTSILLPHLAEDAVLSKVRFPCAIEPKVDGVRGLHLAGNGMTGRSLKPHGNIHTRNFFSHPLFENFDGELAAEHECHPDLCRLTSSATSTHEGEPWLLWHVFDYLRQDLLSVGYMNRYDVLRETVLDVQRQDPILGSHLKLIPVVIVNNMEELLEWEEKWLLMGYEGIIIRAIDGPHKSGRSTVTQGYLLRIKRFIEEDILVTRIEEGEENLNEAQINELGKTFRSTHQENMVANGMLGRIFGTLLKDVKDPVTKKVLFQKGEEVKVGPGKMSHELRRYYLEHHEEIVNHVVKFKFFPKGVKDKPRFPQYVAHRANSDKVKS